MLQQFYQKMLGQLSQKILLVIAGKTPSHPKVQGHHQLVQQHQIVIPIRLKE